MLINDLFENDQFIKAKASTRIARDPKGLAVELDAVKNVPVV
jgi:hypothetical protein